MSFFFSNHKLLVGPRARRSDNNGTDIDYDESRRVDDGDQRGVRAFGASGNTR